MTPMVEMSVFELAELDDAGITGAMDAAITLGFTAGCESHLLFLFSPRKDIIDDNERPRTH